MAGVVAADVVAELAAGLPALFVQCAAVLGSEAEARRPRSTGERPAHMGPACFKKWVVHWLISFLERQRRVRYRYDDDISEAIVTQGSISAGGSRDGLRLRQRGSTPLMSQENGDVKGDADQ